MKSRRALSLALTLLLMSSAVVTIYATQNPQASVNDPIILSDTHGYDFGPYLTMLTNSVRVKWYQDMPQIAKLGRRGRSVLVFTVLRDGAIQNLRIVSGSGSRPLDEAAMNAVNSASPFAQLPAAFSDSHIDVQFVFQYNLR